MDFTINVDHSSDPFAKHFEQEITEELASKLLSNATKDQKGNVLWNSEEVTVNYIQNSLVSRTTFRRVIPCQLVQPNMSHVTDCLKEF